MSKIQDNWTNEDAAHLGTLTLARKLALVSMIRKGDRHDYLVMHARTAARERGATPLDVQRNVHAFPGYIQE